MFRAIASTRFLESFKYGFVSSSDFFMGITIPYFSVERESNIVNVGKFGGHSPGFHLTLTGRGIIGPQERELWPAQQYIAEHRRDWRL